MPALIRRTLNLDQNIPKKMLVAEWGIPNKGSVMKKVRARRDA
jgi:hypothetical protein